MASGGISLQYEAACTREVRLEPDDCLPSARYICEIAPSARRGMLVSSTQMLVTLGIVAGFFTCYGSIGIESSWAWRLPFVVQCGLSLALALSSLFIPPSPRWLLSHGRRAEAEAAISRLSIPAAEADKDMLQPFLDAQSSARARLPRQQGFWSIFAAPVRLRTCLALFLLAMMQLSGIDGVLYYAPLLFRHAGLPAGTATFLASGVSAIVIMAVSIPAFLLADRVGRRVSLIGGGLGMTACMYAMGALYESGSVHAGVGGGRWAVVALIFIFAMLYAGTWAISAKLYAGEIQPPQTRLTANSAAQGVNFVRPLDVAGPNRADSSQFTNFLVAFFTPIMLAHSSSAAYFLFGSFILFTVIVCALYMPETRGRSLEAIHLDGFKAPGPAAIKKIRGKLRSFGLRSRREKEARVGVDATKPSARPRAVSSDDIELQDAGGLLGHSNAVAITAMSVADAVRLPAPRVADKEQ